MSHLKTRLLVVLFAISPSAFAADPLADPLPAGAIARFGSPRFQEATIGNEAIFSADGKFLITSGSNGPACVWEWDTGKLVRKLNGAGYAHDIRMKANGKIAGIAFFGHNSFIMQEWDEKNDDCMTTEKRTELYHEAEKEAKPSYMLANRIVSGDGRRAAAVWTDQNDRTQIAFICRFQPNGVSTLVKPEMTINLTSSRGQWLSDDGNWLLAHSNKMRQLMAFDLNATKDLDKPVWQIDIPKGETHHEPYLCMSVDGKRVVIRYFDNAVEYWDGPANKRLIVLPSVPSFVRHGGGEWAQVGLSRDGKRVVQVVRNVKGYLGGQIIDLETGKEVVKLSEGPFPYNGSVRFSPDGTRVSMASAGVVRVWDTQTGAEVKPLPGHCGPAHSIVVSEDGKTAITSGYDMTVRAWDPLTGREIWRSQFPQIMTVTCCANDTVVVKETFSGYAPAEQLLDLATGKTRALPGAMSKKHEIRPDLYYSYFLQETLLAISADNTTAVTLNPQSLSLQVWSWPNGELKKVIPIEYPKSFTRGRNQEAVITADGNELVVLHFFEPLDIRQGSRVGPDHSPYLDRYNLQTGNRAQRIDCGLGTTPTLVRNKTRALLVHGDLVRDAFTGQVAGKLMDQVEGLGYGYGCGAALSPDGNTLALASVWASTGVQRLFDLKTGLVRARFDTNNLNRTEVAFLPDGKFITAGKDVLVWDPAKAKP